MKQRDFETMVLIDTWSLYKGWGFFWFKNELKKPET